MMEQDKAVAAGFEKVTLADPVLEKIVGGRGTSFSSFMSFVGDATNSSLGAADPTTRISDVMDSLSSIEGILALEERYGVVFPDEMMTRSLTFGDMYSFYTKG
jgi:acyl carrier protein